MSIAELPTLYTEPQLAAKLDVSPATLARARRAGKLSYTRIGNRVRYTAAHLNAYLETQECVSTSKREKASGTSAGQAPTDLHAAHRLAREIAGKPSEPSQGTSSSTTDRETNG